MKYATTEINRRINQTEYWSQTDKEELFRPVHQGNINLYNPKEFTYIYNEEGFRCDSFQLPSELPIIFMGCSCTEGIGLPLEHTWSYRIVTRIRETTGKIIPYWNIALGGAGIDTQAQYLYWLSQRIDFKYVFGLMPPSARREYAYVTGHPQLWCPGHNSSNLVDKLFSDREYSLYQDRRSLMLIDSVTKLKKSKIWMSEWVMNLSESNELYKDFPDISFIEHDVRNVDLARDWMHFGPSFHIDMTEVFWNNIKDYF